MNSTSASTPAPGRSRRVAALVAPALLGALLLTSCGGDDTGATQSTIDLSASSTAFVVKPPATTQPPADTAGGDAVVEGTQEYEVQPGDYPYLLVERFEITIDDLLAVNEWASVNEFPFPGTVILIPPGGKSVDAVLAGSSDSGSGDTGSSEPSGSSGDPATPAATIPDAGDNCAAGSYTIVEGDYEGKVASKFDITVDALRAANASTSGYSAFYPGLQIVIPAKADC